MSSRKHILAAVFLLASLLFAAPAYADEPAQAESIQSDAGLVQEAVESVDGEEAASGAGLQADTNGGASRGVVPTGVLAGEALDEGAAAEAVAPASANEPAQVDDPGDPGDPGDSNASNAPDELADPASAAEPAAAVPASDSAAGSAEDALAQAGANPGAADDAGAGTSLDEEFDRPLPLASDAALPARFDAREQGWIGSYVRQQNPWGSCWAISALQAMEANLVKQGKLDVDTHLAPRHLLMFAGTALPEAGKAVVAGTGVQAGQAAAQAGEGQHAIDWLVEAYGDNAPFEFGGNFYVVYQALASGVGPVLESSAPYRNNEGRIEAGEEGSWYSSEGTWTLPESMRFASVVQLNEAISLPSPAHYASARGVSSYSFDEQAVGVIKRAIMEYGSVAIAIDSDGTFHDAANNTVFTNESRRDNHGVQIVGWDDAFSRRLFTTGKDGSLPEGDGAWIVRNSWGAPGQGFPNESDWSPDGYFYLSYYDRSAQAFSAYSVGLATDAGATDIINQHDFFGQMGQASARLESTNLEFMSANVFAAECDQRLEAVSVDTYAPDSVVTIEVYRLDEGATLPDQGTLLERLKVTVAQAGYHRVQLQSGHVFAQGERFSVVEHVLEPTSDGSAVAVASIEAGNSRMAAEMYGYYHYDTLVVNKGESFLFTSFAEGQPFRWIDATEVGAALTANSPVATPYGNVCIKAFSTKLADPRPMPSPQPAPVPGPDAVPGPAADYDSADEVEGQVALRASDALAKTVQRTQAAQPVAGATPATGDEAPMALAILVLFCAGCVLAVACRGMRRCL